MSEWQNKSDFEINKAVAELEGLSTDNGYGFVDTEGNLVCYKVIDSSDSEPYAIEVRVNYCSNWSDGGSIISENKIDLVFEGGFQNEWRASHTKHIDKYDVDIIGDNFHKTPLRAAMIVYLEMKGVNP